MVRVEAGTVVRAEEDTRVAEGIEAPSPVEDTRVEKADRVEDKKAEADTAVPSAEADTRAQMA